tara:strand:+ start:2682 stop:3689 length:1008 start_codon:yes stop_codon:yes gene_type:complete
MTETQELAKVEVLDHFDPTKIIRSGAGVRYMTKHDAQLVLDLEKVNYLANTGQNVSIQPDEGLHFIQTCITYKLDPWLNEIYLFKWRQGEKAQIQIAAHSFLKLAEEHKDYRGFECGWIFSKNNSGRFYAQPRESLGEDCQIIGAWCQAFRHNRKTPVGEALTKDYRKDGSSGKGAWSQISETMIAKVARAMAHRLAFPDHLGGLYSEDEYPGQETEYTQSHQAPEVKTREERTQDEPDGVTPETAAKEAMELFKSKIPAGVEPPNGDALGAFLSLCDKVLGNGTDWTDQSNWSVDAAYKIRDHLSEHGTGLEPEPKAPEELFNGEPVKEDDVPF